MTDIGFFINYDNVVVQLPVNPDKVTVTYSGNNDTKEIIQLGQINILKDRKLATISFNSFFPESDWFPAVRTRGKFKKPEFYVNFLLKIMNEKRPCRLVITGININIKVSIESFEYYHQAGDHEDMYYTLEFKEYRDYAIRQIAFDSSLRRSTASKSSSTSNNTSKTSTPANPSKKAQNQQNKVITPSKPTVNSKVIIDGPILIDGVSGKVMKTVKNKTAVVNLVQKTDKGTYYHVLDASSGRWLGHVKSEKVKVIG